MTVVSIDVINQSLRQSGKLKKGAFAAGSAEEEEHLTRLRQGRDLSCLVAAPKQRHLVATAGKENDLQVSLLFCKVLFFTLVLLTILDFAQPLKKFLILLTSVVDGCLL